MGGVYYDSKSGKTYQYTGSFRDGTAVFTGEVPPTAGGNYSGGGSSGGGSTNTPKPTITGKLDSVPAGSQSTILAGEHKGTTFTEENITTVKPSSSSTPAPTDSTAGNTNNTNNILTTPLAETIISAVTGENKKPTNTNPVVRPAQQYAQSVVKPQQQQQNFYNPVHFVVSEAPKNSYLQDVRDDDIALSNSEYGVPSGIYRFDNKQEAQKFMKTLSDEYNYDFGDEETRFYDEKTGNFLGFLGAEAFPYAIVIPESRDSEIQSFWNTGGSKGSSPAKGSSWTDTPSPKMTSQLKDEFDFIYTSRDTSNDEIAKMLRMKGIGANDYRQAEISYKLKPAEPPKQQVKTSNSEKLPADRHILEATAASQSDTILNNPFELIGTIIGVGALAKAGSIGGKILGSAADTWVSTGGKTMEGLNILGQSARPIIGGSRGIKTAGEYVTKTADSSKYKLAELGIGAGIGGVYAGKELESSIDFSEIIPHSQPQEVPATGSVFKPEVIPEYSIKSELVVTKDGGSEVKIGKGNAVVDVPETGIGDKYIFTDGNKINQGHKYEGELGEWEKWAEKTRNLEKNRINNANKNEYGNRNSNNNLNRYAFSSPYLFEFVNENRNEEKRRRRERDNKPERRTGFGQIDFYRVVIPDSDFGGLFREKKPEKSRKIGSETYSFVEIDGYRKTNRSRKSKKQPKQSFGIRAINPFGGRR